MEKRLISPEEAEACYNVPARRIRDLLRRQELPGVKFGRTWRLDRTAVDRLIEERSGNLKG